MTNQSTHAELDQIAAPELNARAKGPSKRTQLIKLLSRKSGVDVTSISAKFGWQPHTTRAALSGLRKAGFEVVKEGSSVGKPTRYRIVSAPSAVGAVEVADDK